MDVINWNGIVEGFFVIVMYMVMKYFWVIVGKLIVGGWFVDEFVGIVCNGLLDS